MQPIRIFDTYFSPVGPLSIVACRGAIEEIALAAKQPGTAGVLAPPPGALPLAGCSSPPAQEAQLLQEAKRQLGEYFAGKRRAFSLPLRLEGTAFEQAVWQALCQVPYGQVCTYGELARAIGRPRASRAVGMANHRNPISIVVPCHRVVGAGGRLTGYGGGLPVKAFLLQLERGAPRPLEDFAHILPTDRLQNL